jgi:hypothetical protein
MEGDDRTRVCGRCSKSVHDLSAMTEDDAEAFLAHHLDDADEAIRVFRRPDGTVLTSECPGGARTRHMRRVAMAAAGTASAIAATTAMAGDLRLLRAHRTHGNPPAHSRFEVPRRAVPTPPSPDEETPPRASCFVEDDSPWTVTPPEHCRAEQLLAWGYIEPREETAHAPAFLRAVPLVRGPLPPEVVQRIVRQHGRRLQLCYAEQRRHDGQLRGRVMVRFVIDHDGTVAIARDAGSTIPNGRVVDCVVRTVSSLSFPSPEQFVVVTYPIDFAP